MPYLRRVPPGRAGRLWLRHRLGSARRGADLLDHKLRILRVEQQRLQLIERRAAERWEAASREAELWGRRAAVLGGRRAFALARPGRATEVTVEWADVMGVRYPVDVDCVLPPAEPRAVVANAAAATAEQKYRVALDAAVRHAVALEAVRLLDAETRATRRRVRAIEERWMPRLEEALTRLALELEEEEHSDGVRLRWAVAGAQPRGHGGRR